MTDQVIISRSSFEKLKRVFKEKVMKIRDLENDNEKLKDILPRTIAHLTKTKSIQGFIENFEPGSSDGVETVRKCTQGVSLSVGQNYSAPSTLTHNGREFSESQQVQASPVRTHSHQLSDSVAAHQNKAGTATVIYLQEPATLPSPSSGYLQRLKADRKALQYVSSQNEHLDNNNASLETPIGQECNSSSHDSQPLLRALLQIPCSLASSHKPPCSQMVHQTPPTHQILQGQKRQAPDPNPDQNEVNNLDNISSHQSFQKNIGQNQKPFSESQNILQGTVIDQRHQEPLASKEALSSSEILLVKDTHTPNTLSFNKKDHEECFEIIYEKFNIVPNQSRGKFHKTSLPSVQTSLIPHALDSRSHDLKAVPSSLKNKPVMIDSSSGEPLKLDRLTKSKLMSRNSFLCKNRFKHKKLDTNRDFPPVSPNLLPSSINPDSSPASLNQSSKYSIPKPSEGSSLAPSVSQDVRGETTQDIFTPEAVANTFSETFQENSELSSRSSVCFEDLRDSMLSGKPSGSTVIPYKNNFVVDTVPSVPIMHCSNTNHCYESQSGVAKQKDDSYAERLSKKDAGPLIVSDKNEAFIPENFGTFCLECRTRVMGKKILQHLIFGHMKCKRCDLNITNCHELAESERKKHQCKNAFDNMHDFYCLNSDIVDDPSYKITQHLHHRGKRSSTFEPYLLKRHIYMNCLKSVSSVKPWGSILRKDQQLVSNSYKLPSSKTYSDSSTPIADSKRNSESEEGKDVTSKANDNLSGHLIESDISMQREIDMGKNTCSSDGNTNSSSLKYNSKSSVNSESCSIITAIEEESFTGSIKSMVRPSVVLGFSKSESSSISSTDMREGSRDMINSQTCSISATIVKEDPRCLLKRKLKPQILPKGKRILEAEKSDEDIVAKSYGIEFMDKEVLISKTCKRVKTIEEQEKTDIKNAIKNSDWENVEANFLTEDEAEFNKDLDIVKEEIPELNEIETNMDVVKSEYFIKESWAVASLQPVAEYVTVCNNSITALGCDSQSSIGSSDEEPMSQKDAENNSEVICDASSISQNHCSKSHHSQDSDEKHLIINFQTVETKSLSNVKCPEECPICYTVLCPSRFHVNLKTFHLSSRCFGCGLFITIKLGDCGKSSNTKRIYKRPSSKSKTDPLVSKK